jgi:hypothetical protein
MELLPEWQMEIDQNASPTIRQQLRLGRRYPGIRYHGYRVPPDREDERISFEGFRLPKAEVPQPEAERLYTSLKPDLELSEIDDGDYWYFWWD